MSNTSTIRLFDPVYVVPNRDANREANWDTTVFEIRTGLFQVRIDKQAWKDIWASTCHRVANFAEFLFDFGQGASYSITPRELEGARFIEVGPNSKHLGWEILQAISFIAIGILTCGLGLAALLWVKGHHHAQVIQAEKVADQAFKDQVIRTEKESIISLFDDIDNLLKKYAKTFGLNKELQAMSEEIQRNKKQILDQETKKTAPSKGTRRKVQEIKKAPLDPVALSSTLREQLPNAVLIPLRNKLSIEVGQAINRDRESALANADNTKDQEIKLKKAREIQADLQAIEIQITQILGEEDTPGFIVKRCEQQIENLEFTKELNDGVFKAEEAIVVKQANILFGKMLQSKVGKLIKVPNNGSCLLLSLICSGNPGIRATPDLWNDQAFELRQKLVGLLRQKIEEGKEEGFLLKVKIQSEMADSQYHAGYTQELKSKIVDKQGKTNIEFIESEEANEGWQAYLKCLEDPATFTGEVELSVLPELMGANILVYKANLEELVKKDNKGKNLPLNRDEQNRLHVFCPRFANENTANYIYSKQDREKWILSHKLENGEINGKVLPTLTIPEEKPYERDICVVLRGNHYDMLMPSLQTVEEEGQ